MSLYGKPKSAIDTKREKWLIRQNRYWTNTTFLKFSTRVGEIYEVDFGENIGSEFSGRHLALCLCDTTTYNERVLVIPLTTQYERYNLKDVFETTAYFSKDVVIKAGVVINEAKYISKMRIFKTSMILGEPVTDKLIPIAHVDLTKEQLERFKKFIV